MLTVSKQQSLDRWDVLPENLREEMVSDMNSDFIWQTCEAEHIPDKKIYTVSRIAGAVIMGFLHPEDMAKEVRDALGIDIRIATSITNAINQRIFVPLRADIDKIYNPISRGTTMPKIMEEIHPPMAELIQTSTPAPLPIISPIGPASAAVPPAPKPEPIKPASEKVASLDEFARIGKVPAPIPASAPAPKPVFLQTESISRPIPNAPDFRVPAISENIMGEKKEFEPLPMKTAVVEFGGMPVPKPAPQSMGAPRVTVVRYGSENSAAPATPPRPEPMRTITEITPETLKTVAPTKAPPELSFAPLSQIPVPSPIIPVPNRVEMPKPPAPTAPTSSMPPAPQPMPQAPQPAGQPVKIIQKDYSVEGK